MLMNNNNTDTFESTKQNPFKNEIKDNNNFFLMDETDLMIKPPSQQESLKSLNDYDFNLLKEDAYKDNHQHIEEEVVEACFFSPRNNECQDYPPYEAGAQHAEEATAPRAHDALGLVGVSGGERQELHQVFTTVRHVEGFDKVLCVLALLSCALLA